MTRIDWKYAVAVCLVCLVAVAQGYTQEKSDFQKGKIVTVKKLTGTPSSTTSTGSDAQLRAAQYKYIVSVQVADKVYDLQVESVAAELQELLREGAEVDIKVDKRTAQVKDSLGRITDFPIVATHPAG